MKDDFFTSKRIKKLRKMAGGDTYTIIYLKMQLLSLKTDGVLTYTGLEDDFASELALDLDEETEDVKVVLMYLLSCGLIETSDNVNFFLPYVAENTGKETAGAQRVRDHRARKALQCNAAETPVKRLGNVEKEIDKELELEKELQQQLPQKQDDGFEEWWDLYPKKSGDIRQAYQEYIFALDDVTAEELLTALKSQTENVPESELRYFPSADKWLRNRTWKKRVAPKEKAQRAFTPTEF